MIRLCVSIMFLTVMLMSMASQMPFQVMQDDDFTTRLVNGRDGCVDAPNVATIEFLQSNPVSLPSHETLLIEVALKDSTGASVGIDPDWGTDEGTIEVFNGLQQARFTPNSLGVTNVWACAGNVNETLIVNVLQGSVESLHLETNSHNVTADDAVVLNLTGQDIRGNIFDVNPPKQNWTIPNGSSISVGATVIWSPGVIGLQNISVQHAGLVATIALNVSHGTATELVIEADSVLMTADETVDLNLVLRDAAGNSWPVVGNWSTEQPEATTWLIAAGSEASFNGHKSGSWTIMAEYTPQDVSEPIRTAEIELQVLPGELAQILLDGHGATISVDDSLDLNPRAVDSAGNLLSSVSTTWTINGNQATNTLESNGYVFTTETIGHYVIEVDAQGGSASVTFDVVHGAAVRLVITSDGSTALVANSGESLELLIEAEDQYANRYVTNAEFEMIEGIGSIAPSNRGTGYYGFTPSGVLGFVMLNITAEEITEQLVIDVRAGDATKLSVSFDGELRVGNEVIVKVQALDESANVVTTCDSASIVATSPDGDIKHANNNLYFDLNQAGPASITVGCLGLQETFYFEVESAILGGLFEDSETAMLYFSIILMAGITSMLIILIIRRRTPKEFPDPPPLLSPQVATPTLPPTSATSLHAPTTAPAIFIQNRQQMPIPTMQYPWGGVPMHMPALGYGVPHAPEGMQSTMYPNPPHTGLAGSVNPVTSLPPPTMNTMDSQPSIDGQTSVSPDHLVAARDLLGGTDYNESEHGETMQTDMIHESIVESVDDSLEIESELPVIEIPELDFDNHPSKPIGEPQPSVNSESSTKAGDADDEWGVDW